MTSFQYFNFLNFFSDNVDDGKASSLTSTAKRCAMALIAKVTWNVATKYNFDYKKNLDRDRKFNYTRFLINYLGCMFGKSYCAIARPFSFSLPMPVLVSTNCDFYFMKVGNAMILM